MSYEFLQHTADVRLKVIGNSLEDVFSDALQGLMELVKPGLDVASCPIVKHNLQIESPDRTALLIDFLSEVLFFSHTHNAIYTKVVFSKLTETEIHADIEGVEVDGFEEDVKAVTYHEANLRTNEEGKWETMVIFDI